jgi:hypothetical protein
MEVTIMMNLSNLKKVSAFAFGIIAGFAIDKYANAENVSKLKARASEAYEKLSNKLANATEPKVEYVQEGEVSVDNDLLKSCDRMILRCKPNYAASLCEHIRLVVKTKGYITINDIVELSWLADDTIDEIANKYTVDECALMGWSNNYDCGYSAGQDYMLISYPEELTDLIYNEKNDISVDTGSIMDTYQKWNKNADVLRFTTEELQELAPRTKRNVHAVLADLYEKLDDDYFVSVATLMQVIWDIEKNNLQYDISFKDRFPLMTKNYDEDTLINYGWEDDDDAFCSDVTPDSDFYIIIKQPPHNITSLVEEWTKENRKEFEEETKAE